MSGGIGTALQARLPAAAIHTFTAPFDPGRVAAEVCSFYDEVLTLTR
jgi:hypothetical protein